MFAKLSSMVFAVPKDNLMPQSWNFSTMSHASSKCMDWRESACKQINLSRSAGHIQQVPSSSQWREGREIVAMESKRVGLSKIWISSTSCNASSTFWCMAVPIVEYSPDTLKIWKTISLFWAVVMASKIVSKCWGNESLQSMSTQPASQLNGLFIQSTKSISISQRLWKCDMLVCVALVSRFSKRTSCFSQHRQAKYIYIVWYEARLLLVTQGSSLWSWMYSDGVYTHVRK